MFWWQKIGELNVICQYFTQINPIEIVVSVVTKLMIKTRQDVAYEINSLSYFYLLRLKLGLTPFSSKSAVKMI